MPRTARIIIAGAPHHVFQCGVKGRVLFSTDRDYQKYLDFLAENSRAYGANILAYCLLKDRVHVIAVPKKKSSLAGFIGRTHYDYVRYLNGRRKRTGELWYDRFNSCVMDARKLRQAVLFVDQLAIQKKLVRKATKYKWSSAAAHATGKDGTGILDLKSWPPARLRKDWVKNLSAKVDTDFGEELLLASRSGRPIGGDAFIDKLEKKFKYRLRPLPVGRPPKS